MHALIIEDERDLAKVYQETLPAGWTVEIFTSAREAIYRYLKAPHTYDLVIGDVALGEKSGEGFIFDIKLINPYQNIVVVTGNAAILKLPDHFGVKVYQKPVLLQDVLRLYLAPEVA